MWVTASQPSFANPGKLFAGGQPDNAAIVQGALLAFDNTEVSAGTTANGITVSDPMAVSSFVRIPTASVFNFLCGVAQEAGAAAGFYNYIAGGSVPVLVKNPIAGATLALAVGDLLVAVPGQRYAQPSIMSVAAGTSQTVRNRAAKPVGFVTVAETLEADGEALVQAFIFPMGRPIPFSMPFFAAAAPGADLTLMPLGITRGPGVITAVEVSVATGGSQGSFTTDILLGPSAGTSIFTTLPTVVNDCTDAFSTLINTDAPGGGTGPGTAGSYGTINAAACWFADRTWVRMTHNDTSTWNGTGLRVCVEGFYF